jgi:DNA-binding LytR/AlgR family response regulator
VNDDLKIRCIVVDDEPFALKLMADDLSKIPYLELKETFSSPLDGLAFIRTDPIDLIFLDIQMPVLKGTELLRSLTQPPFVIFTTAFEQYALEGFELDVIDYLMKPIPFDRLLKAVNRVHQQISLRKAGQRLSQGQADSFFFVHSEYKEIKIFHRDIVYIEGLKDYVKIFLQSQPKPILTRLNLKAIERKLPDDQFSRIHNSYIVSLSKITSTQKLHLFLGSRMIPIGDRYAEGFRRKYGKVLMY